MKVTMLENRKGTEDGFHIKTFYAGKEYDLTRTLARAFLNAEFAYER